MDFVSVHSVHCTIGVLNPMALDPMGLSCSQLGRQLRLGERSMRIAGDNRGISSNVTACHTDCVTRHARSHIVRSFSAHKVCITNSGQIRRAQLELARFPLRSAHLAIDCRSVPFFRRRQYFKKITT